MGNSEKFAAKQQNAFRAQQQAQAAKNMAAQQQQQAAAALAVQRQQQAQAALAAQQQADDERRQQQAALKDRLRANQAARAAGLRVDGPTAGFSKMVATEEKVNKRIERKENRAELIGNIKSGAASTVKGVGTGVAVGAGAAWSATKAVGRGFAAVGRGIKNTAAKMGSKKDKPDKEPVDEDRQQTGYKFLLFFAIIVHIVDASFGYQSVPSVIVLALYGIILITFHLWVENMQLEGEDMWLIVAITLAMIVPRVMLYLAGNSHIWGSQYFGGLIILLPIAPIYFWSKVKKGKFIIGLRNVYWFAWGCVVIMVMLNLSSTQAQTINSKQLLGQPVESVKIVGKAIAASATDFAKAATRSFNMAVAQATGQQYEADQESVVGITISKFNAVDNKYNTDSLPFLQASISATNIKEKLAVSNKCFIPDSAYVGTVNPAIISLQNGDENVLDCHFGTPLKEGFYNVKLVSTFTFNTTSDITYYFVDETTRPEMYNQQDDKLQIPAKSVAIYTGGPVELGLPSLSQPLRISMDKTKVSVGNYVFGVSLINKWPSGHVVRGLSYVLEVPSYVGLYECTRKWVSGSPLTIGDRKQYKFTIDTNNAQEVFDSVSCRMHVDDPNTLFSSDPTTKKLVAWDTFTARATYEYAVEAETPLEIKKSDYKIATATP